MKDLTGKKYLAVTHQLTRTGAPQVLFELLIMMRHAGAEIDIIALDEGSLRSQFEAEGMPVRVEKDIFKRREELLREWEKYDGAILNTLASFEAAYVLNGSELPVLWWIHENGIYFDFLKTVLPDFAQLSHNIQVRSVSSLVQKEFRERYGIETDLLSLGVEDTGHRHIITNRNDSCLENSANDRIQFITVGLFSYMKGVDVLADAIWKLPDQVRCRARFTFIGDTSKADPEVISKVEALTRDASLAVEIAKQLPHEKLLEVLSEADWLLTPSRVDMVPTITAEALMEGTPCILTEGCGIAEFLENDVSAKIVPIEDVDSLVEVITDAVRMSLEDAGALAEMTRRGRLVYEKVYSREVFESAVERELILMEETRDYHKRCYILGRYQDEYREMGIFDQEASALIHEGLERGDTDYVMHMAARDEVYERADKHWAPVLVFVGDMTCYGVLDGFARSLAEQLDQQGYIVDLYDLGQEDINGLPRLFGKRFTALIGFQCFIFSARMQDGASAFDKIPGPKINVVFDHPVWMKEQFAKGPEKDYYVVTHDHNYKSFVEKYYPKIQGVEVIPPGGSPYDPNHVPFGMLPSCETAVVEDRSPEHFDDRELGLSFVGSYHDWHLWQNEYDKANQETNGLAEVFRRKAEEHVNLPWEESFSLAIEEEVHAGHRKEPSDQEFLELLYLVKPVCFMVMCKKRGEIIKELLDHGIELHVYGESWRHEDFRAYQNLVIHPEIGPEESLGIYRNSKMSLNIMSWHKDGMTERIANIQRNGALCISDESTYLRENYKDDEDIVLFQLDHPDELAERILGLEKNPKKVHEMALLGKEKADRKESWEVRGREFAALIERLQ